MAARAGMIPLITRLRELTATSANQTTVGGITYWSDDQLQDILDDYVTEYVHQPLTARPAIGNDSVVIYRDYLWHDDYGIWLERPDTVGAFVVQNSTGYEVVGFTIDYKNRKITFPVNTDGRTYYITAKSYDMDRAAAEVWYRRAGFLVDMVDWSTDNHSVKDSQAYQHYMARYKEFMSLSGITFSRIRRVDTIP
jgi:hypothetical protein